MNHPAVIRLFHLGLKSDSGTALAEPFPLEEFAASPLAIAQKLDESNFTLCEEGGLSWLECPAEGLPAPVYITGAASSSLDVANLLHQRGLLPEWASVLCLSQSSGRGQMRRAWASPAGNAYAALRLPNEGPFATFAAAPAIGGLVAEALHQEGFPVLLKWPNDLLQPGEGMVAGLLPGREECHKVGGILLEERRGALIAGIGLNIASAPDASSLRDDYVFSAGVLERKGTSVQNGISQKKANKSSESEMIFPLWKRLVERIFSCYGYCFDYASWWPALAEKHLAFRGCHVSLADACPEDDTLVRVPSEGIVEGVSISGALRLRTKDGLNSYLGGSLLPRQSKPLFSGE